MRSRVVTDIRLLCFDIFDLLCACVSGHPDRQGMQGIVASASYRWCPHRCHAASSRSPSQLGLAWLLCAVVLSAAAGLRVPSARHSARRSGAASGAYLGSLARRE